MKCEQEPGSQHSTKERGLGHKRASINELVQDERRDGLTDGTARTTSASAEQDFGDDERRCAVKEAIEFVVKR